MIRKLLCFLLLALVFAAPPPNTDENQPDFRQNLRMGFRTDNVVDNQRLDINGQSRDASGNLKAGSSTLSESGQTSTQSNSLTTGLIVLLVGAGVAGIAFSIYRFQKKVQSKQAQQETQA